MRLYRSVFTEAKLEVPKESKDYFDKLVKIASKNNGILPRNIRELIEKTYQASIGL